MKLNFNNWNAISESLQGKSKHFLEHKDKIAEKNLSIQKASSEYINKNIIYHYFVSIYFKKLLTALG